MLTPKIYVAVCGLVDSGKSTLIKTATEVLSGRKILIDSLCNEQNKNITIKQASIDCPYKNIDIIFLDCPGHKEFKDEIKSGLSKAQYIIRIIDCEREQESLEYQKFINGIKNRLNLDDVKETLLFSKAKVLNDSHYNISNKEHFSKFVSNLVESIKKSTRPIISPIDSAVRVIKDSFKLPKCKNPTLMCSYGKDSVVLLDLMKKAECLDKVKILYMNSPFDMDGISEEYKDNIKKFFNIEVYSFDGVPNGWDFSNHSVKEIMAAKSQAIKNVIKENSSEITFVGARRHEGDGTRSKDKFFSPRDNEGNANLNATSFECLGYEYKTVENIDYSNCRVSPILDFTEIDIWKYTLHNNLPVCSDYFSKNGLRYRSLGDKDTTTPIQSNVTTIEEMIEELKNSTDTERICRKVQDSAEKFAMENIRSIGFF